MWGSPAGKRRIAQRLVALLPEHKTYVEPFIGAGAVLFAKKPAEIEAINDADPEIADAYRAIKKLTTSDLETLRKMEWVGKPTTFHRIYDAKPRGELEKLHRFLYVARFSYGTFRNRSFNPALDGVAAATVDRLAEFGPRLKNVRVYAGDYERVVRKYDGSNTVLYLDPPYPGYNAEVGEGDFDEDRFLRVLKSIKGKFLATYGIRGELPGKFAGEGFEVKRIRPARTIRVGGSKVLTTLLVSNYKLIEKRLADALGSAWEIDDHAATGVADESAGFVKTSRLIKGADPSDERFVLGIVLEPEVVDAQQDIYSAEAVRVAAHRFMEEFGGLGLMHQMRVNGQVKVLESYIAPHDFTIGEDQVRKGTWLLAVRVLSDELWQAVKDGALTGFSIGGSARRVPESVDRGREAT
ncbi:MAG: XkdF-like putative serine protease domain-containing protein [Kofleriaceae bacterium]